MHSVNAIKHQKVHFRYFQLHFQGEWGEPKIQDSWETFLSTSPFEPSTTYSDRRQKIKKSQELPLGLKTKEKRAKSKFPQDF